MEQYFKATAEIEAYYDSGYCECTGIEMIPVTKQSIIDNLSNSELRNNGLIKIKPDKHLDKNAVDTLRYHGWVHYKTAKDIQEKKVLEEKFLLVRGESKYGMYTKPEVIDPNNISNVNIYDIAKGDAQVVQVVSLKSILSEKDYNKILAEKEQIKKKAEIKKKNAEEKKKKEKLLEIEKAKKLLATIEDDLNQSATTKPLTENN